MRFASVFILFITLHSMQGQAQEFAAKLNEQYEQFKATAIAHKLLKQADIQPMIEQLRGDSSFEVNTLGQSVEGRNIYLIKTGNGPTTVLMWSQMHGDESTATMALWDLFNFLQADTEFEEFKRKILEEVTLYVIPMLNPDGAERFRRRNALDIDLNRDALRLQSPEAKILKNTRDSLNADFGFNLHDQSSLYSAGKAPKMASISFLAPAYNFAKDINMVRGNAMKVIVELNEMLQKFIPGHVAKYNDTFEPRAFGDNIQKWGTSTILVESGGYYNDPERQHVRKMNFLILVEGLRSIAEKTYYQHKTDDYFTIPDNARYMYHLILRDTRLEIDGKYYQMDIGVNRSELHQGEEKALKFSSRISEMGDMSPFYGYEEIDTKGMKVVPGKTHPETFLNLEAVAALNFHDLLRQGYTSVKVAKFPTDIQFTDLPLNIVMANSTPPDNEVRLGNKANFILHQNNKPRYGVVNGFIYDLTTGENKVVNAMVY